MSHRNWKRSAKLIKDSQLQHTTLNEKDLQLQVELDDVQLIRHQSKSSNQMTRVSINNQCRPMQHQEILIRLFRIKNLHHFDYQETSQLFQLFKL